MSLPDARAYCEGLGESLIVPHNQGETNAIRALLPSGSVVTAWLGLTQDSDMNWIVDRTGAHVVWPNFSPEEGNDQRGENAGAAMRWASGTTYGLGQWYDMTNNDGRLHYAVCSITDSITIIFLKKVHLAPSCGNIFWPIWQLELSKPAFSVVFFRGSDSEKERSLIDFIRRSYKECSLLGIIRRSSKERSLLDIISRSSKERSLLHIIRRS